MTRVMIVDDDPDILQLVEKGLKKAGYQVTPAENAEVALQKINRAMPEYVVNKAIEGLNGRGKAVKGSSILLVGMAYKPDVDDMRESCSLKLMDMFVRKTYDFWRMIFVSLFLL